jgi:hypothetical protein
MAEPPAACWSFTATGFSPYLGTNVFDYGQKSAAEQMRISW